MGKLPDFTEIMDRENCYVGWNLAANRQRKNMNPYRMIPPLTARKEMPSHAELQRMFPDVDLSDVSKIKMINSCSQNSVLALTGKASLLRDIRKAAQGSGCRVEIITSWTHMHSMPALLAILDPNRVDAEDWTDLCEAFGDAAPENIKFLLTDLSPHTATLPIHNVVPMPSTLDAASLQAVMCGLRDRPPVIAALAPHYPEIIAQMPGEFKAIEFLYAFADFSNHFNHLCNEALDAYLHSPDPGRTVASLMAGQLYDFPSLIERVSGELPISLFPEGEMHSRWRKKK